MTPATHSPRPLPNGEGGVLRSRSDVYLGNAFLSLPLEGEGKEEGALIPRYRPRCATGGIGLMNSCASV